MENQTQKSRWPSWKGRHEEALKTHADKETARRVSGDANLLEFVEPKRERLEHESSLACFTLHSEYTKQTQTRTLTLTLTLTEPRTTRRIGSTSQHSSRSET